ncbi:hypothetical protein [Bifidobacterium animalis]
MGGLAARVENVENCSADGRIRTNVRMRGYTGHIAKATASIACVCCI